MTGFQTGAVIAMTPANSVCYCTHWTWGRGKGVLSSSRAEIYPLQSQFLYN